MRCLGLDVGDRRIGIAISDPDGRLAVPLETLYRQDRRQDIDTIAALVEREQVETVVVGLPLSLDGTAGPQAEQVQEFAVALRESIAVPVELWDERLSTVQANHLLRRDSRDRKSSRKGRREKGATDAMAATIILGSYLDSKRKPELN